MKLSYIIVWCTKRQPVAVAADVRVQDIYLRRTYTCSEHCAQRCAARLPIDLRMADLSACWPRSRYASRSVRRAAPDRDPTFERVLSCKGESHNPLSASSIRS